MLKVPIKVFVDVHLNSKSNGVKMDDEITDSIMLYVYVYLLNTILCFKTLDRDFLSSQLHLVSQDLFSDSYDDCYPDTEQLDIFIGKVYDHALNMLNFEENIPLINVLMTLFNVPTVVTADELSSSEDTLSFIIDKT